MSCFCFEGLSGRIVVVVWFLMCLLMVSEVLHQKDDQRMKPDTRLSEINDREVKSSFVHQGLDLNYMMSKRKVPHGPDPIHNRRAGNSRRPPGQV